MTAALRFRNLTLGYDRHPAVHHLDGAVENGALVAVVGPNGAGKSTLFKGIVGVIKPLAGGIERGDPNPQNIAYLPQAADIDRTFPINVYDMVSMGLCRFLRRHRPRRANLDRAGDRRRRPLRVRRPRNCDALGRADAAHAVRAALAAGCARDRAR
jgi:ABC-type Mn2+/Zn2+ transport system ATPase subunit